jgi:hypothetical protein
MDPIKEKAMKALKDVLARVSDPKLIKLSYAILILLALVLAGGAPDSWGLP